MSVLWVLLNLMILSLEDIREGKLSMAVILELAVSGGIHAAYTGHMPVYGPGLFLLGIGFFSGEKIGYGDGWLVLALGMWMTFPELLSMILLSVGLCVPYGLCRKKAEVPLVPFLTFAYLIGECL